MIEGKKTVLGGEELILPPLPMKVFRTRREWFEQVNSITGLPTADQTEAICGLIAMALQRNYPEKDAAWVEDNVDMGTAIITLSDVLNLSRFIQVPGGGSQGGVTPES